MNELDIVQLIEDFDDYKSGQVGTIVHIHQNGLLEVEFDKVISIPEKYIRAKN